MISLTEYLQPGALHFVLSESIILVILVLKLIFKFSGYLLGYEAS